MNILFLRMAKAARPAAARIMLDKEVPGVSVEVYITYILYIYIYILLILLLIILLLTGHG